MRVVSESSSRESLTVTPMICRASPEEAAIRMAAYERERAEERAQRDREEMARALGIEEVKPCHDNGFDTIDEKYHKRDVYAFHIAAAILSIAAIGTIAAIRVAVQNAITAKQITVENPKGDDTTKIAISIEDRICRIIDGSVPLDAAILKDTKKENVCIEIDGREDTKLPEVECPK